MQHASHSLRGGANVRTYMNTSCSFPMRRRCANLYAYAMASYPQGKESPPSPGRAQAVPSCRHKGTHRAHSPAGTRPLPRATPHCTPAHKPGSINSKRTCVRTSQGASEANTVLCAQARRHAQQTQLCAHKPGVTYSACNGVRTSQGAQAVNATVCMQTSGHTQHTQLCTHKLGSTGSKCNRVRANQGAHTAHPAVCAQAREHRQQMQPCACKPVGTHSTRHCVRTSQEHRQQMQLCFPVNTVCTMMLPS
eukprot:1158358-Pelagomonas_calceolata.AAC.5